MRGTNTATMAVWEISMTWTTAWMIDGRRMGGVNRKMLPVIRPLLRTLVDLSNHI